MMEVKVSQEHIQTKAHIDVKTSVKHNKTIPTSQYLEKTTLIYETYFEATPLVYLEYYAFPFELDQQHKESLFMLKLAPLVLTLRTLH